MNKLFKYSLALMVAAFGLASCSDSDDNYQKGTWDAADGYTNIFFDKASQTIELDPAEPTEFKAEVFRRNKENAATIHFDIKTNTDDVFTVSDAVFAAGDSVADITISFPKAETGKPYTLTITDSNPADVSPKYSKGVSYTLTVTRVKWNPAGYYIDESGNKVEGWAMYTDDIITGFYGVQNVSYPVQLEERDDKPGYFRVLDLYKDYPYDHDFDNSQVHYLYIDATNPNKVYFPERCYTSMELGEDGQIIVWGIAGLRLSQGRAADAEGNYGTYANGAITFPAKSLLIAEEFYNDGGLYTANPNGLFKLVIDPSKDLYTASIQNGDFDWEKVFAGTYMSAQLGVNTPQVTLYKGIAKADVEADNEGCYDRFAETYGTVYKIAAPYAAGYDIVFCVKDGKVIVPEGFESQALGFKGVGYDIYGAINAAKSTFTDDRIDLEIAFQNQSGEVNMGSNVESLLNITFTVDMVTGSFNYWATVNSQNHNLGSFTIEEDPLTENGLVLKNFYLEGSEVAGSYDLDAGKMFVAALEYLGDEDEEGTTYHIFTYSKGADENNAAFDINMDGKLTSQELILVGSPDMQNLYYWVNASQTVFEPAASAKRAGIVKGGKKGAKLGVKLNARQRAQLVRQMKKR